VLRFKLINTAKMTRLYPLAVLSTRRLPVFQAPPRPVASPALVGQ
jgi:hypothetical protein